MKQIYIFFQTFWIRFLLLTNHFNASKITTYNVLPLLFFISPEVWDFILFSFYYLNIEFVLCIIVFIILFNKEFFLRRSLTEVLTFIQVIVFCHIFWIIAVTFDYTPITSLIDWFPYRTYFSNQYFYFFSTTDIQLRFVFIFDLCLYFILSVWSFYYIDIRNQSKINLEIVAIFLSNIIFCGLLLKVNSLFAVWCLIECISIVAYILASFNSKASINYSFIYFVFNSIAGAIMLWGISLLTPFTHSDFYITPLFTESLIEINIPLFGFAFTLIFLGFFIKLGLIPFHMWAVEVYKHISTELLFTFLVINKSVLIFTIYRILSIFTGDLSSLFGIFNMFLIPLILITTLLGAIFAFSENNLHAFLALSSLPQSGYVLIGLFNADFETRITSLVYFLLYLFVLLLLYYILFLVQNSYNYIADLTGVFYTNKALGLGLLFVFGSFSGIPPFGTFIGKFYLFNNLALTHSIWVVLFFLLSNVISLIYYLRIAVTVLTPPTKEYFIESPSTNLPHFWLLLENVSSDTWGFAYFYGKITLNITVLVLIILGSNFIYPFLLLFFTI
jgi:NADH-quinone oxidoreductase subunit N